MLMNLHSHGLRPQPEPWHLDMVADMAGVSIDNGFLNYPHDWKVPQSGWQLHPCHHLMVHVPRAALVSKAASVALSSDDASAAAPAKARGATNVAAVRYATTPKDDDDDEPKDDTKRRRADAKPLLLPTHCPKAVSGVVDDGMAPQTTHCPKPAPPLAASFAKDNPPVRTCAGSGKGLTPAESSFFQRHRMPTPPPPPTRVVGSEVDSEAEWSWWRGTADDNCSAGSSVQKRHRSWG